MPEARPLAFGPMLGVTNSYIYGDKDLASLLKNSFGLALGLQAEGRLGTTAWHASVLYEQRSQTHTYLGSSGRFNAEYLTLAPRVQLPLYAGVEGGAGLALSQLLRTSIGSDLDYDSRAKVSHGRPGPMGILGALSYKYRLAPTLVLTPELTLDEALTSARAGATVRYEVWTLGIGCLFE